MLSGSVGNGGVMLKGITQYSPKRSEENHVKLQLGH
jgi:hypothetical protein